MTKIIFILKQDHYLGIKIFGHTMFEEKGKDIICAGISSIVFGGLNALKINDKNVLVKIDKEHALVEVNNISLQERIQGIVQTLHVQLETIYQKYPEHVKIIKESEQ